LQQQKRKEEEKERMMNSFRFLLTLFSIFGILFSCALSQEDVVNEEALESSPDVSVHFFLPNHLPTPTPRFISGDPVEILILLSNSGENTFNISYVFASIRHPYDFRYHLQNFTAKEFNQLLLPHEQISLSYFFTPDFFEERDYGFTAQVFYFDQEQDQDFVSNIFNGTVSLAEPDPTFDVQTLFTYVLIITVLGLIGFAGYKVAQSYGYVRKSKGGRREGTRVEYGTGNRAAAADASQNEWLQNTAATNFGRGSPRRRFK